MKNFLLLSVCMLSACGTVFSGSNQIMNFDSNVKNVSIYANGALVCSSVPCQVDIERASGALIIMAKAKGYEDNIQQIRAKVNPVSWGNLLSVYSWTTDFATSSMWKYSRDGTYINMKPLDMKKADLEMFKKNSEMRYYALMNYSELKIEAASNKIGEYISSLAIMSGINEEALLENINKSQDEVCLVNNLSNLVDVF